MRRPLRPNLDPVGDLQQFQEHLGHHFRDPSLLEMALTHPSLLAEPNGDGIRPHNQRLEFLGDAVVGLVLSEALYRKFPQVEEGPLTKARAHMVNSRALAEQARKLRMGEVLRLSRGEERHGGRHRSSALSDAYEAVIGAVFLDAGFDKAREIVLRCFEDSIFCEEAIPTVHNPKGELQEVLQTRSQKGPKYLLLSSSGPDHDRLFECAVMHEGRELGRGSGKTKRAAESEAAAAALARLKEEC